MISANHRFILLHIVAFVGGLYLGISWTAFFAFIFFFYFRTLGAAIAYHRFFSHRCFKAGRVVQFILGLWGATSGQRGPLWWASLHRHHHRFSDTLKDLHSPKHQSFWSAHVGWVLRPESRKMMKSEYVQDLSVFPELLWLEKYATFIFLLSLAIIFPLTWVLKEFWPELSYLQMFIWGGLISFLCAAHATLTVNSVFHLGEHHLESKDCSRNIAWAWPLIMGENLHQNHHLQPGLATNQRSPKDKDPIFLMLLFMEKWGLIHSVRKN